MNRPPVASSQQPSSFAAFAQQNGFGAPAPRPLEQSSVTRCSTDRVMLAGGQLMSYVTPASMIPFEAVYRKLPLDGIFSAIPSKPVQFEMGSFTVPVGQSFVLLDYHFNIFRPTGAAAGDFVPLESNRLPTQVGWDITVSGQHQGNYHYEINPTSVSTNPSGYQSNPNAGFIPGGNAQPATNDQFDAARFAQVQSTVASAMSLMPQRHHRQGIMQAPAPWIIRSNETLAVTCSVIRAVPIPIAFFEAEVFGFLIQASQMEAIQSALAPCHTQGGI